MNALYNIGTRAYFSSIRLAAFFGHRKARLMQAGRRNWAARLEQRMADVPRPIVWFHAASLGEFEQGRPLIEELRRRYPHYSVLVTFFSPSGYEVRKNYKGADLVTYLPYDTRANARRFLDIVRPEVVFFIKYEFWGNMLAELDRRDIPTDLVSGIFRRNQAFFRWYGGVMRPMLHYFSRFFVQDEESKQLLAELGFSNNVTVCGDTRFDRVLAIKAATRVLPWAEAFSAAAPFTLVAGSTWPKDEEILLDHFNRHPEMKLIIAPHEIHEEHVRDLVAKLKRPYRRYSEILNERAKQAAAGHTHIDGINMAEVDCLVIDAIGFLSSLYRYGDAAYVGGGFGAGIHNTLEAAVYGIPVVFGPKHGQFREALGLIEAGGAFAIDGAEAYDGTMDGLIADAEARREAGRRAGAYVQDNSGASDVIFTAVFGKRKHKAQ